MLKKKNQGIHHIDVKKWKDGINEIEAFARDKKIKLKQEQGANRDGTSVSSTPCELTGRIVRGENVNNSEILGINDEEYENRFASACANMDMTIYTPGTYSREEFKSKEKLYGEVATLMNDIFASLDSSSPAGNVVDTLNSIPDGDDTKIIVATRDNHIIGYVIVVITEDGGTKSASINSLAVVENYRRIGVASRLIKDAENEALSHECEKITASVPLVWNPALRMFLGLGYNVELCDGGTSTPRLKQALNVAKNLK